jgi:hypothetical protein
VRTVATTAQNRRGQRHWSLVLPHAPLPESLAICLDMVGSQRYERAAISWHTRFCSYAPELTFADAQAMMTALAALPSSEQAVAATQLAALSRRYGLDDVANAVESWSAARPVPVAARQRPGRSRAVRGSTPRSHHPTAA